MSFADPTVAADIRDTIAEIARSEINKTRPADKYAEIQTIDQLQGKATVTYPGETTAVPVSIGTVQPVGAGAIVRISGQPGDRFVQDIVSGATIIRTTESYLERSGAVPGRLTIEGGSGLNDWVLEPNGDNFTIVSSGAKTFQFGGTNGDVLFPNELTVSGTGISSIGGILEVLGSIQHPTSWFTVSSKFKITSVTDPTASSTNHSFDIGSSTDGSGFRLKLGPSVVQACFDTGVAALKLNNNGGAILGRLFQMTPVRAITANQIVGSGASATSISQLWYMQMGKVTVTATTAVASFSWPSAWANGVICCVFTGIGNASVSYTFDSTSTVTTCKLFIYAGGAAYTGSAEFNFFAIGW